MYLKSDTFIILAKQQKMIAQMNKAIAGYHMLLILSAVDGKFHGNDDKVIHQYMEENFNGLVDTEKEMSYIVSVPKEDYPVQFNNAMNAFYMDSTQDERNHFLDLAVKLVIADKEVTPRENLFLNELFNAWEANYSF